MIEFTEENTYGVYITATDETYNSSTVQRNIIYALPETLEVTIDPVEGGSVFNSTDLPCPDTCTGTYDAGSHITLTAQPAEGYIFTGWIGCDITSGKTCTIVMNTDISATASFTASPTISGKNILVVFKDGDGNGTITSNPSGINCNDTDNAECESIFNKNASVKLTSKPSSDSIFKGWSGYSKCEGKTTQTCSITIDDDYTITAVFELIPQYTLGVMKAGSGTVTKTDKTGNATFTISNTGDAELKVTGVKLTGKDAKMFKVLNDSTNKTLGATTIAAGDSLTVKVIFRPASNNQKTATLKITSDDPTKNTGVSVTLTGTGSGFTR